MINNHLAIKHILVAHGVTIKRNLIFLLSEKVNLPMFNRIINDDVNSYLSCVLKMANKNLSDPFLLITHDSPILLWHQ